LIKTIPRHLIELKNQPRTNQNLSNKSLNNKIILSNMSEEKQQSKDSSTSHTPVRLSYRNLIAHDSAPSSVTISEINRVDELIELSGKDRNNILWPEVRQLVDDNYRPAFTKSVKFYFLALKFLGSFIIIALITIGILAFFEKTIPQGLIAIGSASIGVFTGIFSVTGLKN